MQCEFGGVEGQRGSRTGSHTAESDSEPVSPASVMVMPASTGRLKVTSKLRRLSPRVPGAFPHVLVTSRKEAFSTDISVAFTVDITGPKVLG